MTMPGPIESMAEYLVKIGWDVDELGLDKAVRKVKNFENGFVKSIANISSAIVELVSETAKIDLAQERMARQYWISEQAARSLSTSLDALGMSYDDLFYATDEQYARFLNLNNYAKQLEGTTSSDIDKTLVKVRDIQFEFSKMKVWFNYFTREVVYQISKYIDLDEVRKNLKYINDVLMKNLPKIAEWVGKIFSWVWRLGSTALKVIYTLLKNIFDILGVDGVAAIGLIGGAIKLLKSGPLGWLIFALTSLLLLVEDFMTWKSGGKSALGDLWEQLSGKNGVLDVTKTALQDTLGAFKDLLDIILDIFNLDSGWELFGTIVTGVLKAIEAAAVALSLALDTVVGAFELLTGDFDALENRLNKGSERLYKFFKSLGLDSVAEFFNPDKFKRTAEDDLLANQIYNDYMKDKPPGYDPFSDPTSPFFRASFNRSSDPLLAEAIGNAGSTTTTTTTINNNVTVNSSSGNANDIARTTRDTLNDMASNRNWRLAVQG